MDDLRARRRTFAIRRQNQLNGAEREKPLHDVQGPDRVGSLREEGFRGEDLGVQLNITKRPFFGCHVPVAIRGRRRNEGTWDKVKSNELEGGSRDDGKMRMLGEGEEAERKKKGEPRQDSRRETKLGSSGKG